MKVKVESPLVAHKPSTKKDTTSKALREKNKEMDSFAVLGLEHGAEEEEVKKAYKSLAKRWILLFCIIRKIKESAKKAETFELYCE